MTAADDAWFAKYGGKRVVGLPDAGIDGPATAGAPAVQVGGQYGLDQQVHDDTGHDVALRDEAMQQLLQQSAVRGDGGLTDDYYANALGNVDMGGDQLASSMYTMRGNTMRNAQETQLDAVAAAYKAALDQKLALLMPKGGSGGGGGGRGRGGSRGGGGSAAVPYATPTSAPDAGAVRAVLSAGLASGHAGAPAYPTAPAAALPAGAYQSAAQQGAKQTNPNFGWGYTTPKATAPAKPKPTIYKRGAY